MTILSSKCDEHPDYVAGCPGCRKRAAERARARAKLAAYGRPVEAIVDAGPAREHIWMLEGAGLSQPAIGAGARVATTTVGRVSRGLQTCLRSTTAQAILSFRPVVIPGAKVSSLGASRRLQALGANGWGCIELAPMLHASPKQVGRWRWRARPVIRHEHHLAIVEVYRWLGDRPGPSEKARGQARRFGYAPTICWDDDGDLDDPRAQPKGLRNLARVAA